MLKPFQTFAGPVYSRIISSGSTQRQPVCQVGIDGDQALRAATHQQARILFDKVGTRIPMVMVLRLRKERARKLRFLIRTLERSLE